MMYISLYLILAPSRTLINNISFRQFFMQCSFVHRITEITKLDPKVLGQSAQLSVVLLNQSSVGFYTVLTVILEQVYCFGKLI